MKAFQERDKTLTGETIELVKAEFSNALGPNLKLVDCEVISKDVARGIIVSGVEMVGGVWRQKKKLSGYRFSRAAFENVRFEGHFHGCVFGDPSDPTNGPMRNCDFSGAKLTSGMFAHIDPAEVKIGPWPAVGFADPQQFRSMLSDMDIPHELHLRLSVKSERLDLFRFFVDDATDLEKSCGMTQQEIREILERLPGVVIHDA